MEKNNQTPDKKLSKNDFIELAFTGMVKDGDVFDTNIIEEAKKINMNIETRPIVICLGQGMILPSIDDFLIGKELGEYEISLIPEKAFGTRKRELVKTMPSSIFKDQQQPKQGMMFNFDNMLGRISAISGGRIIVDFNNPLAGREVDYKLNVKRKIQETKEKASSLIDFFFRKKLEFEIKEKKLIISVEKNFSDFIKMFEPKFKEILGLELEIKVVEDKPLEKVSKIEDEEEEKKRDKKEGKKAEDKEPTSTK